MDIVNIFSSGQSEAEKDMLTTTKSEKQMGNLKGCAMLESAQAKRGFLMNEALNIAQGTRDKRITPSRCGNSKWQ